MARPFMFLRPDGSPSFGGWCSNAGALSVEVMARAGFDWICIDCQHGLIDYREMCSMVMVAEACDVPALVRVSWNSPSEIMRALDAGASAVVIPMVSNATEASAAASAVRYAPEGSRSWGPIRASLQTGELSPGVVNKWPRCVVQVETREAMGNLDEIMLTEGVDGVYVGPADLAIDHGIAPTFNVVAPEHLDLLEKVLTSSRTTGVPVGVHTIDGVSARRWADAGFSFVTATSDVTLLKKGAEDVLSTIGDAGSHGSSIEASTSATY